ALRRRVAERRRGRCDRALRMAAADPDRVLAAAPRRAVEPAVDRVDDVTLVAQQLLPLRHREPRERHLRVARLAADAQYQRARLDVPVGALPDARLALEPA